MITCTWNDDILFYEVGTKIVLRGTFLASIRKAELHVASVIRTVKKEL